MRSEWNSPLRHCLKLLGLAALVTMGGCGSMPIGVNEPANATLEASFGAYDEPESSEELKRVGDAQRRPQLMSNVRKQTGTTGFSRVSRTPRQNGSVRPSSLRNSSVGGTQSRVVQRPVSALVARPVFPRRSAWRIRLA
jgi:hypothetical protein